ncbi:MAG: hypothetical protein JNJ60_04465 [Rhodocyclaceae bacterium]|nr:hypothetical protein [Rhodocyclaceae bacterium]
MSGRRNSVGGSDLSQRVITNLETSGAIRSSDRILNVHHYNSQQDQRSGMTSSVDQNSQIVRVRSNSGSRYEVHSHDQGEYHSRTVKL